MWLTDWSWDPSLVYVIVAGALYALGSRDRFAPRPLQALSFYGALATIVIALDSPIDAYADQLFWVHMIQHILLLSVAPPLLLLGQPWPRMWRALPLGTRTRVGRSLALSPALAPLRALARPVPAWLLFSATVLFWHVPFAYQATLTYGSIHLLEHAMFFFTGLLFWARVIDPGPLRQRLIWPMRIAYASGAMVVQWMLAITLVMVPHPLYHHYLALASRPGGISALTDQSIAAGIMWVPGSVSYALVFIIGFYRWLEPEQSGSRISTALTS